MRHVIGVAVLSIAVVLATRLPARTEFLFSWDSVNFALGMTRIDIARHQPHPPGYFGYVLAARSLRFGDSENAALLRVNIAAAALAALVSWCFVWRVTRSRRAAAVAWAILVTSPLCWFYSVVAEIYAVEMLITVGIAAIAHECMQPDADRKWPWLLGAAVALAALCKLSAAVLMGPLVAFAAAQTTPAARRAIVAAIVMGSGIVLLIVSSLTPLDSLWQLSNEQFTGVSGTSAFSGFRLRAMNRTVRDIVYAVIAAVGAGGLAAVLLRRRARAGATAVFLATWTVPYVAMSLLLHFPKGGYALPLLPPLALWIGTGFAAASRSRTVAAVILITGLNAAQFALVTPWSAEQTGGGRRYTEKTSAQKVRTELNSIIRPSLGALRRNDSLVGWFIASSSSVCNGAAPIVLISTGSPVSWRHAMFYMPDATVIQVPDSRAGVMMARHREIQDVHRSDITVSGSCAVLGGERFERLEPGTLDPARSGGVVMGEHRLRWTTAPLTIPLQPDGRLLQIRP